MEKFKLVSIAFFTILLNIWNKLSLPLTLLIVCNIIDIITGIWRVLYLNKKFTFKLAIWGLIKKISMYFIIIIGYIIDVLIIYSVENFNINIQFGGLLGSIIAIWLVLDELLSIIRNLIMINVPIPNFLIKIINKIKNEIDDKQKLP